MKKWTDRTEILIGTAGVRVLQNSSVAIIGLGGVGSYAAEAIARAGIGHIVLIDKDRVDITNINRQMTALHSTIGMTKADVMRERIMDIHPDAEVEAICMYYSAETANEVDLARLDYIIDAIDDMSTKIELITRATAAGVSVISCMGTGNKMDASAFQVSDIRDTSVCPVARIMRRELKKRGIENLRVVYSREVPQMAMKQETVEADEELTERKRSIGSISFVPPSAGLLLAGEVIKQLLDQGSEKSEGERP